MNIFYTYFALNIYYPLINKKRDFGATLLCVIPAMASVWAKFPTSQTQDHTLDSFHEINDLPNKMMVSILKSD